MSSPKRVDSWVVTDNFWQRVEPLIPARQRVPGKTYLRKPGAGRPAPARPRHLIATEPRSFPPIHSFVCAVG